jgi:hypothetical protein
LDKDFPKIGDVGAKKTSEPTDQYNCIAWAFGDNSRWWWPMKRRYWPVPIIGKSPMEAFMELFDKNGWIVTSDRGLEPGQSKIALFVHPKDGQPKHAARLMDSGLWTSKLGSDIDLSHELEELEGPAYGIVSKVFKKQIP